MKKASLLTLAGIALLIFSCKHESLDTVATPNNGGNGGSGSGGTGGGNGGTGSTCSPDTVYFQQQVLALLVSNCTMSGCHDEASHRDGVVLTSYEKVMATADIEKGNPAESKLYRRIIENDPRKRMPLGKEALKAEDISRIYKWIQQGARNNSCTASGGCNTSNVKYSTTIQSIIKAACLGCHGGSAPSAGINLSAYAGVKAKVDDGKLLKAIRHEVGASPMPKNGAKLSDCDINGVKAWIDAGAQNN